MTVLLPGAHVIEGTPIRLDTSATPVTSISGVIVTPDIMTFSYTIGTGAEVTYTWTNGSGDPTGNIINYGVGLFYVIIPTKGTPGTLNYCWYAQANGRADITQTTVKFCSYHIVDASPL